MEHLTIVIASCLGLVIFALFNLKREGKDMYSMPLTTVGIIIFLAGLLLGYDTFSKSDTFRTLM